MIYAYICIAERKSFVSEHLDISVEVRDSGISSKLRQHNSLFCAGSVKPQQIHPLSLILLKKEIFCVK